MTKTNHIPDLAALRAHAPELERRYAAFADKRLALDMTRGKPCPEQLDLANALLESVRPGETRAQDGTDCRNYGVLDGLPESKALFAEFMDVSPKELLLGDNSSLALMHDALTRALLHGVPGGAGPWATSGSPIKFLCPVPGYDRHFAVCEHLGFEMINVDVTADGLDIERVESLVAADAAIKGMWVVPKYSNPTGVTCSAQVVERLARMRAAAPDFRIMWDNAYAHHHLTDAKPALANLLDACKAAGHPDRVWMFGSTSKVSFAGAGIAMFAGSEANVAWYKQQRSFSTIGPDKLNELRHVRFFKNMQGIHAHMAKHQSIIRPKFDVVDRVLRAELSHLGIAQWTQPDGGYFVSLDTLDGCARRVVQLAAEAGVKLTSAGATFPYGKDPRDRNIRIAPTLPSLAEIETAMQVLSVCIQRATLEIHAKDAS